MPINNLLYVDDDSLWCKTLKRSFQRAICPNVDTAENILEVNLHNNLTDIIKTIYTGDIRRAPKNFSI